MTNKRRLTPAEVAMAERIRAIIAADPNLTEESIGNHVGVSQGMVSHWTGGRHPVPARRAAKLAEALGLDDPGEISTQYREIRGSAMRAGQVNETAAHYALDDGPQLAKMQAELDNLRAIVAVMLTTAAAHRPIEGADLARRIRKHVPRAALASGYVEELLTTLEKVVSVTRAPAASKSQAGPSSR